MKNNTINMNVVEINDINSLKALNESAVTIIINSLELYLNLFPNNFSINIVIKDCRILFALEKKYLLALNFMDIEVN